MRTALVSILFLATVTQAPPIAAQATGTITGIVRADAPARPLPAARVTVQGTERSATTDAAGRYTITGVPAGRQTVSAQAIGYAMQVAQGVTVGAGETETVNFHLETQGALQLEGIVAVGYGTQRRRDLTGSVASVDVDAVETAPITSFEQVLQGRAPGVQVVRNNGGPGGGISVRVRGTNSITANNQPLYVIDGVPAFTGTQVRATGRRGEPPNPLADINPNDIASIEILKDASATAIYGSRGANGVVLITTRRGVAGAGGLRIESSYGMQDVTRTIPLLNAREYAELANEAYRNAGFKPLYSDAEVASFGEGTDWQEQVFRTAPVQDHAVTLSGGDEQTRFLVSGGLFDQQGVIEGSDFRRYSGRVNLDREVSERFRVGNSLTLTRSIRNGSVTGGALGSRVAGTVLGALWSPPTQPVRDEEGNLLKSASSFFPVPNPLATATLITNERTASRVVGNIFGEFDFTEALRFRSSLGGNAVYEQDDYFAPNAVLQGEDVGGDAQRRSDQSSSVVNENILTYQQPLRGLRDNLDLTAGFTVQTYRLESVNARSQQFSTDVTGVNALDAGALSVFTGSGADEWALLSWLGRANYNVADKYLLTLTGRYDGSSKFGAENKWGFFPSGALAWRVSAEPFMQDIDWVTDLKLRTSYGVTGNQEIGTYNSLARLGISEYVLDGSLRIGYSPAGRAPNPDLRWEATSQFDVGVDLSLFDERLSLTADYYRSVTEDLLLVVALPATTGFRTQLQNVGSVQNRGFELGIQTYNVDRPNFTWRTALNLARNRNEVLELGEEDQIFAGRAGIFGIIQGSSSYIAVGYPLGTFYGFRTDGIWQVGDDIASSGDNDAAPGEYRYVDVNGDGKITTEDRTTLGNAEPDLFGGMANNFTFGPVSLDVFVSGSWGGKVFNAAAAEIRSVTARTNETVEALDRWTPENPSPTIPRANAQRTRHLRDVYIEDGSYLRLQNVTLGYQLPARLVAGAQRARVYLSGQDLWTWTDYSGFDPEVNSMSGDPGAMGVDLGAYPRARTVNVGIDVTL